MNDFISPKQCAAETGVDVRTIQRAMSDGRISVRRIGGHRARLISRNESWFVERVKYRKLELAAALQKRQAAADLRDRKAAAADLRDRIAAVERDRIAAALRDKKAAAVERDRIAAELRDKKAAAVERNRKAAVERNRKAAVERDDAWWQVAIAVLVVLCWAGKYSRKAKGSLGRSPGGSPVGLADGAPGWGAFSRL